MMSNRIDRTVALLRCCFVAALSVAAGCGRGTSPTAPPIPPVQPQAVAPVISPAGGTYAQAQTVSLTDATAGAMIYYTTDGSAPTASSTVYTAPFSVAATETLNAIAAAPGDLTSSLASADFTITPATPKNYSLTTQTSTLTLLYQSNAGFGIAGYGVSLSSPQVAKTSISRTPVQIFTCGGKAANASSGAPAMCDGSLTVDPPAPNQTTGDVSNYAVPYSAVTANATGGLVATAKITTSSGSVFNVSDTYTAVPNTAKFSMNRNVAVVPAATNPEIGFNSEYAMAFNDTSPDPLTADHVFAPSMWYKQNANAPLNAYSNGQATAGVNYFVWGESYSPMPVVMLQDPTGDVLALAHTGPGTYGPHVSSPIPPACYASFTNPCPGGTPVYDSQSNNWLVQSDDQYGSLGLNRVCPAVSCGANPPVSVSFIYPQFAIGVSVAGARQPWNRRSHPLIAGVTHQYTLTLTLEQDSLTAGSSISADFPAALQNIWRSYLPLFNTPIPLLPSNDTIAASGTRVDVANLAYQAGINLMTNQADDIFFTDTKNNSITGVAYGFPDPYDIDLSDGADPQNGFPQGDTAPSLGAQMGFTGKSMNVAYFIYRDGVLSGHGAGYPVTGNSKNQALGLNALNFWAQAEPAYQAANGYTTGLSLDWYHENSALDGGTWDPGTCPTANSGTGPAALPILLVKEMDALPTMVDAAVFARQHSTKQTSWETYLSNYANFLIKVQNADGSFYRAYDAMTNQTCPNDTTDSATDKLQTLAEIQFLVKMYFVTGNGAYSNAAIKAASFMVANNFVDYAFVGGIPTVDFQDSNAGAFAMEATLAMVDLAKYQTSQGDNQTGLSTQAWVNLATEAGTYYETWQYVWSPAFNTSWPAYQNAGGYGVLKDREGSEAGGIGGSAEAFNYYRLHLLTENSPSGHFGQWAQLVTYNTKLSTEYKGVTATAYGKTYNQDFTYPLDGAVSEAVSIGDMNGYGQISGWHSWLTAGALIGPVYLYDSFGDYSVSNLLNQVSSTLQQQQTLNVPQIPMFVDWGR